MNKYALIDYLKNGDEFMDKIAAPDDAVAISVACDIINHLSDYDFKRRESFALYLIPKSDYQDFEESGCLSESDCIWVFNNNGKRPGLNDDEIDIGIDPAYL